MKPASILENDVNQVKSLFIEFVKDSNIQIQSKLICASKKLASTLISLPKSQVLLIPIFTEIIESYYKSLLNHSLDSLLITEINLLFQKIIKIFNISFIKQYSRLHEIAMLELPLQNKQTLKTLVALNRIKTLPTEILNKLQDLPLTPSITRLLSNSTSIDLFNKVLSLVFKDASLFKFLIQLTVNINLSCCFNSCFRVLNFGLFNESFDVQETCRNGIQVLHLIVSNKFAEEEIFQDQGFQQEKKALSVQSQGISQVVSGQKKDPVPFFSGTSKNIQGVVHEQLEKNDVVESQLIKDIAMASDTNFQDSAYTDIQVQLHDQLPPVLNQELDQDSVMNPVFQESSHTAQLKRSLQVVVGDESESLKKKKVQDTLIEDDEVIDDAEFVIVSDGPDSDSENDD